MIDDQHKTITELTQIINTDQSGLTGLSLRPSEELIDHTEKAELGLKRKTDRGIKTVTETDDCGCRSSPSDTLRH
jgi:hypothetical protein